MKNDTQNQRYDQIKQFYDSYTALSVTAVLRISFSQDNAKLRRWRATKEDRDYEFETTLFSVQELLDKEVWPPMVPAQHCATWSVLPELRYQRRDQIIIG